LILYSGQIPSIRPSDRDRSRSVLGTQYLLNPTLGQK
jgi:hypothetical protein